MQNLKTEPLRDLYPPIEPFNSGVLKVDNLHTLYWEQCGNKDGKPVVFLHGGPGGGIGADDRRYFDPKAYSVILFDQRGAGKSTPHASLEKNTTWDLVDDIEKLRELLWFYQEGASHIFPDIWHDYLHAIPEAERHDMMQAYHKRLTGSNQEEMQECAKAWSKWECATSKLYVDPAHVAKAENDEWAVAFARIECHYFVNKGFFESDGWLLENVHKIRHIPGVIVQGRYDLVCPAKTAWELHSKWPEAELKMIPDAGHSAREKSIAAALLDATDKFRDL
ncbi:hypothetical protein HDV00_008992 [Rhizophlyctis rosea]|nr:hypothetical protein HDV00_008992 [Rhizophlyctis rosea]